MRKAATVLFILLLGFQLSAQDNAPDVEPDWDDFRETLYTTGDQTFIISLGTEFPVLFLTGGKKIPNKFSPPVGGGGYLAYSYYLNTSFFFGFELGVMFLPTIGENTLFIIPLGLLRGGYQFNVWRLEFPLSITVGMVWHRYLNSGYYGLYTRAGGSAYFRAMHNWSFGLSADWYWFPQWADDKKKNVDGHVIGLMLSARYHF
jgi:hypothetical protein